MDIFDRFSLYAQAIGLEYIGAAWDLAQTHLDDENHFKLASLLGKWGGQ